MDLVAWQMAYRLMVDVTRIDGATNAYVQRTEALAQLLHGVLQAEKKKLVPTRPPSAPPASCSGLSPWARRPSSGRRRLSSWQAHP